MYETLLYLAGGLLLSAMLWFWIQNRSLNKQLRDAHAQFVEHERQGSGLQKGMIDNHTELFTPWYFADQIDDYFHRTQAPVSELKEILMIKLMGHDAIGASFGAGFKETVIRSIAAQLKALPDCMASYLGQGIFAVFGSAIDAADLLHQLEKSHNGFHLRFAAGSAYWPEQGRSASKLIRHAETALHVCIDQHKTWLPYDVDMEPGYLDLEIISLFVDGEVEGLSVVFQPQLNLHTGKLDSAEALVRWNHPQHGEIPPVAFVPLLEAAGLTTSLTCMMIDKALQLSAFLQQKNIACIFHVNVGLFDILHTPLLDFIRNALAKYNAQPRDLRLECAGDCMQSDISTLRKILSDLDELGIATALDGVGGCDFSLAKLAQLPLVALHIDRHFIGDMLVNPQHENIVCAALAVGRSLEMSVLAEGVEDDKTLQHLKADGCDYAQGFVIAHPMDEPRFIEFMQTHGVKGFNLA